jgi:DNA-binding CsgD family transcriptional regulator
MSTKVLSPREEEIVQLCVEGLTNDAIAATLGLSVGTVNTYWLRIRLKVGGTGRTETVVRIIKERAEKALREANTERTGIADIIAQKERGVLELRAALALLQFAMEQIRSTVWATDRDLSIHIIANGEFPSTHYGIKWEVGKTVYQIFKTKDSKNTAVAAHLRALDGHGSELRLDGEFANMLLRVMPLQDEVGEVLGCISILNTVVTE